MILSVEWVAVGKTAGHHSTTHNYRWITSRILTFSIVVLCMDFASWIYINLNPCLHELSQSHTRQPHNSNEIISKISVYAIIVSQGRHVANLGHVHGLCMLSYCTSNQQLVKMSFKNWVPICNVETCLQTGLKTPMRLVERMAFVWWTKEFNGRLSLLGSCVGFVWWCRTSLFPSGASAGPNTVSRPTQ